MLRFPKVSPDRVSALLFYSLCGLWASLTFSKALASIFFVTTILLWASARYLGAIKGGLGVPKQLWIPLALYSLWIVLSAVFSEVPKNSFRGLSKVFQHLVIFFVAADSLRDKQALSGFFKFVLITITLAVLNAFAQYWIGHDLLRWKALEMSGAGARLSGSFGTYGMFANFLLLVSPFVLACAADLFFSSKKKGVGAGVFILFLISLAALFLTRSRGALLAFFAGSAAYLVIKRQWKFLLLFFFIACGGIALLPKNMVIHLDADLKEQSVVERLYLWDRAIHVIQAKPLLGTGINTYAQTHARYDKRQNWRVRNYYAHNGYLQMAAEIGLPGLFFYLWFLVSLSMLALKFIKSRAASVFWVSGLFVGALNFIFFSAVDTVMHNPLPVKTFWYLLGILTASLNIFMSAEEHLDCSIQKRYPLAS